MKKYLIIILMIISNLVSANEKTFQLSEPVLNVMDSVIELHNKNIQCFENEKDFILKINFIENIVSYNDSKYKIIFHSNKNYSIILLNDGKILSFNNSNFSIINNNILLSSGKCGVLK